MSKESRTFWLLQKMISQREDGLVEDRVSEWLSSYQEAWRTYDPAAIGALFSEDAVYRYHPYDEPLRGREAIVASWLEDPDVRGTYEGDYHPVVVTGDTAIATGSSTYRTADGSVQAIYDNCFILRFDGEGRCRDFTEWFMRRPDPPE
jgi:ketosteroid isomerase-like protein